MAQGLEDINRRISTQFRLLEFAEKETKRNEKREIKRVR